MFSCQLKLAGEFLTPYKRWAQVRGVQEKQSVSLAPDLGFILVRIVKDEQEKLFIKTPDLVQFLS